MFDRNIDVAKIMRKIKTEYKTDDSMNLKAALKKGENFDHLVRELRKRCSDNLMPGNHLPQASRFPAFCRKFIQLFARCIRKSSGFILRDQYVVNESMDRCIATLTEKENLIFAVLCKKIEYLEKENRVLKKRISDLEK